MMAETRRGYIFGAFVSSVFCVILSILSVSSDQWIVSLAVAENQNQDSLITYGLFRGELVLHIFETPSHNTLYMTCAPDLNACAVSCKTESLARSEEVRALAQGFRPNLACVAVTTVEKDNPLPEPPVLSFGIYLSVLVTLFIHLATALAAGALALLNATRNPTETIFSLPGCIWMNIISLVIGLVVLLLFGIYWATSTLKDHLAFSYTALGFLEPLPELGYSYWVMIGAVVCSSINIGLIRLRQHLLERDPPPPTIKVENHSDGTVFLY